MEILELARELLRTAAKSGLSTDEQVAALKIAQIVADSQLDEVIGPQSQS